MGTPLREDDRPWQRTLEWVRWVGPKKIVTSALVGVVVIAVAWWLLKPAAPDVELTLGTLAPDPSSVAADTAPVVTEPAADVYVHVAGSVVAPGVVRVASGARVIDAVTAAGGALPRAALDSVNLAAVVADGERVYVPAVGEIVVAASASAAGGGGFPIDLNRAVEADLDRLPGIGPTTAAAIVVYRTEVGRFVSVDDLLNVPGIGPAKVAALRDLVTV